MAKVMLSLPDDLLEDFDRAAKERHKRRSELFKDLALQFLKGTEIAPSRVAAYNLTAKEAFERLREFQFDLEPGETAEGIIREMRDRR